MHIKQINQHTYLMFASLLYTIDSAYLTNSATNLTDIDNLQVQQHNKAPIGVRVLVAAAAKQHQQQLRHKSYDHSASAINDNNDDTRRKQLRRRRQVSDWWIAPNTRWCGRGNIANDTYNHLGGASSADKCCRKHDHCKLFIPAMSNRYDLFNYRPYTLSHCNCDRRFRTCLKMANDEDASTIGKLFFNMVQTQCFIIKSEHVCQARSTDGSGKCLRQTLRHKAHLRNNKKF